MLAIVGVAAVALGTGFLNNDINLWIQQFGVGTGDISTPTDHVLVDFNIERIAGETQGTFRNVVDKCVLTPDDKVGQAIGTVIEMNGVTFTVTKDSEMTCKITNRAGQIIAEGTVTSPQVLVQEDPDCVETPTTVCAKILQPTGMFNAGVPVMVPVSPVPDVFDVHDVVVVVHANTYTMGDLPPVPATP